MSKQPEITVRLVHIDGPRKGEIDKKINSILQIGRHPDCDILYPAGERSISRKHAQIIRTGNRFRLLNQSPNGSYVNGQISQSTFLHNGDVIMFSKDGPKLSFLYTLNQATGSELTNKPVYKASSENNHNNADRKWQSIEFDDQQKTDFTIQFGPKIYSFNQHMIKIGAHFNNDVVIQHPLVMEQHAEIRYQHNNYFIKSVYQKSVIYLNRRIVDNHTRLIKHDVFHLGLGGPQIRYLGTGRFMEVIAHSAQTIEKYNLFQGNIPRDSFPHDNKLNYYNQHL